MPPNTSARNRRQGRRPDRGRPSPAARAPAQPSWLAGLVTATLNAAPWKVALVLAVIHLVLAIVAFDPTPHVGGDNAAYVALARSLVERHAYLELWDPAAPPHTQYPPVWPVIIAALSLVGLHGWIVLKATVTGFSVLCIALAYLWLRRTTSPSIAMLVGALLAIAPGVVEQAHWELSDVPAWAFTMLALWASTHLAGTRETEGEEGREAHHLRWLMLLVVAATLGNFTRSAGLPLVVAAGAWLAWRRQWRDLAVLCAVFFPLAFAWWLRGKMYGVPGYLSHLWAVDPYQPRLGNIGPMDMVRRIMNNLFRYQGMHLPVLLTWASDRLFLGGAVMVLAAAGWARRLSRPGLAEFWAPLYVALLLIWPATWSAERFVLPMLPLILCYAAEALRDGAAAVGGARLGAVVPAVAAAVLALAALPGLLRLGWVGQTCSRAYRGGDPYHCMNDEYHDFFTVAAASRGKLPPNSAVLSRKPTLLYILGGYPGRVYPLSANPDTFFMAARDVNAHYVIFDRIQDLAPLYLHPVLLARRDKFCVIRGTTAPNAAVLRIEPNAPARPGGAENAFRVCDVQPRFAPAPAPARGAPPASAQAPPQGSVPASAQAPPGQVPVPAPARP